MAFDKAPRLRRRRNARSAIDVVSYHLYVNHPDFERPFSRQTWLGSARNFARTRFKRFRTFEFSTPKTIFRRKFGTDIFVFCLFGVDFGELRRNERQNQLRGQILLQIDLS